MERLIIDQECIYLKDLQSSNFDICKDEDGFQVQKVNLDEYNGYFSEGKEVAGKVIDRCSQKIVSDIEKIINARDKKISKIEYGGASLTPFIFLAAHTIKNKGIQLNNIELWHNFRNPAIKEKTGHEGWSILKTAVNASLPILESKVVSNEYSWGDEVVIIFSTSCSISEKNLKGIPSSRKTHSFYCKETKEFEKDTVFCRNQAERYAIKIRSFLEDHPEYRKVHLVISSSVAMTFCLAYNLLCENNMPEIIVYHYDAKLDTRRPWGIAFKNRATYDVVNG